MAGPLYIVQFLFWKILRWILDTVPRFFFDLWFRNDHRSLPPVTNPLLLEPAITLAAKIRNKQLKSRVLIQAYIDRIKEVQPHLNAVVEERFEDALKEADEVDRVLEEGQKTPQQWAKEKPLLGIPFTAKDSVGIKGMCQTAGLVCRKNIRAESDAVVVKSLRDAGAIPVALTNIPELVMWYDSNNKLYGRTNNPYNFNRICGGSSGGEGSLISAGGSVIGVGTDIGGSIRFPAFFCGIFGHKSTPRVVSNEGMYPPPYTDDVLSMSVCGPMCRYACDLLPMFKAMILPNAASQLKLDEKVKVSSLKVYYMENDGGNPMVPAVQEDINVALKKVVRHFSDVYGIAATKISPPEMREGFKIWMTRLSVVNAGKTFDWEMGNREYVVNPYKELTKCIVGRSDHTLLIAFWACLQRVQKRFKNQEAIDHYLQQCDKLKTHLVQLLGNDGVLILPGNPQSAPYHHETLWKFHVVAYTGIFNALGLPVTMCPMGLGSDGLPIGVQVVAAPYQDRLTIAVAREIENAFGGWMSPAPIVSQ